MANVLWQERLTENESGFARLFRQRAQGEEEELWLAGMWGLVMSQVVVLFC